MSFRRWDLPPLILMMGFPLPEGIRWSNHFQQIGTEERYCLIPMRFSPMTDICLAKEDGIWWLINDPNFKPRTICKLGDDQESPVGVWTLGAQVYACPNDGENDC